MDSKQKFKFRIPNLKEEGNYIFQMVPTLKAHSLTAKQLEEEGLSKRTVIFTKGTSTETRQRVKERLVM